MLNCATKSGSVRNYEDPKGIYQGGWTDPGQSGLQGYKRRVQGSNGLNPAQLSRPGGSTQIVPLRHNRAQRLCRGGHANVAWGAARTPTVVSRQGRTRLPSEKNLNKTGRPAIVRRCGNVEAINQYCNGDGQATFWGGINQQHDNYCQTKMGVITPSKSPSTTSVGGVSRNQQIFSLAKSQSGELYRICESIAYRNSIFSPSRNAREDTWGQMPTPIDFLEGTQQFGVAMKRRNAYICRLKENMQLQNVLLARTSGENSWSQRTTNRVKSMEHGGSDPYDHDHKKNSIKSQTHKRISGADNERGAQCVVITTTYDNSGSHVLPGRYQPCASASTFNPGVKVEGGARDLNRIV